MWNGADIGARVFVFEAAPTARERWSVTTIGYESPSQRRSEWKAETNASESAQAHY